MAKLRELIPNYTELLSQGLGQDELIAIAQKRVKSYVPPVSEEATAPQTPANGLTYSGAAKEAMESGGVIPQVAKGLANTFVRSAEALNGVTGLKVPAYDKLVKLGEDLEAQKEKRSERFISPDRKDEKDALKLEAKNAQGFWEDTKAGVKQMADVVTHPSEWTIQGATETLSDPSNAITLGLGKVAGAIFKTPVLKFLSAGVAGAGENAITSSATEYAIARGQGKSVEEAKKIATQAAAGGAAIGAPMGMAGSMLPSSIGKPKEIDESVREVNGFSAKATGNNPNGGNGGGGAPDAAFGNLGENDTIFNFVESEIVAQKNDVAIKGAVQQMLDSGVRDPAQLRAVIDQHLEVSETDAKITLAVNNGNPLPKDMMGTSLPIKVTNTIEAGTQSAGEVYARLKGFGASDELANAAAQAVEAKNPDIFHAWWAKKLEPMMQTSKVEAPSVEMPLDAAVKPLKEGKLIDDVTNVREDVEYVVLPKEQVKTEFGAGDGYQFRSQKQDGVIKSIKDEFDADRHFGNDGGFDGVPVVDSKGNVLIGNHRADAIKKMSDEQFMAYQEAMRAKYPNAGDGVLVRRLKSDANAQTIAKVSNDRRVKFDSEKMIVDGAKYKASLEKLPERVTSEAELKNLLGANDEIESNRATLSHVSSDKLPYAIDRYMNENKTDLNFKQMFYKNAHALYNVATKAKKAPELDIVPLLDRAIDTIRVSGKEKGKNLQNVVSYYDEMLKMGGRDIEGNAIKIDDFLSDVMGVALKHYRTLKDDGVVEFGRRLDDVESMAEAARTPSLFEEAMPMSKSDVVMQFLNESDRSFIHDIAQRIEKNENEKLENGGGRVESTAKGRTSDANDAADNGNGRKREDSDSLRETRPTDEPRDAKALDDGKSDVVQTVRGSQGAGDVAKSPRNDGRGADGERRADTKRRVAGEKATPDGVVPPKKPKSKAQVASATKKFDDTTKKMMEC